MGRKNPESIKFQLEELKLIYENLQNALSAQKNTFHIFTLIATAVIASLGGALSSDKSPLPLLGKNTTQITKGFYAF